MSLTPASVLPVSEDSSVHRYMLSIITAHVKKSRPELETVLEKVKHLKGRVPAQYCFLLGR